MMSSELSDSEEQNCDGNMNGKAEGVIFQKTVRNPFRTRVENVRVAYRKKKNPQNNGSVFYHVLNIRLELD